MKPILGALLAAVAAAGNVSFADTCFTDTTRADFATGTANNVSLDTIGNALTLGTTSSLDQQNITIDTSAVGFTTTTWGGQTFTPSISGKLVSAEVHLFCSGCSGATPSLTVGLRATSGGLPTGTDIAAGTIAGFGSGTAAWYTVTLSGQAAVTAGTQYALVIRPNGNPTLGTYALSRSGTATTGADVYAGGTRVALNSANWIIPLMGGVTSDIGFKTTIETYVPSGDYTSATKDSGITSPGAAGWTTLNITEIVAQSTTLRYQAAASQSAGGPFSFVGPDGTAATYFDASGASLAQFNGNRYLRYRALLATNDGVFTPAVFDVTVCAAPLGPPDLAVAISDNRGRVRLGDNLDYLIEVTNANGSETATANVTDTLPPELDGGTWVCTATGGATCASGTGNTLNDAVQLPAGGKAAYLYSARVLSAGTDDRIANTVTAALVNGTDPTPADNAATDTDIVVIFEDGFDGGG